MKGASKVIMGATLVMVVSLAIMLGLILVLLAELYCSLLLRRRQLKQSASGSTVSNTATAATAATNATTRTSSFPPPDYHRDQSTSPLGSFYAQGVLHAPRNFLFPAVQKELENENHPTLLHQVLEVHAQESNTSPHHVGILSPTSPSASFATSPNHVQEISIQVGPRSSNACAARGVENFVYISNPIYDNDAGRPDTPFETPDTSPSCLENCDSSGGDDDDDDNKAEPSQSHVGLYSPPMTPPLSPMKKLPAQACSVSLRDATFLVTSGSDSNSNNGHSSSSSGSPCTSPSW
ncbi:hypothetical protein DITRI_Ditri03aG0068600 [Diplodiscus trichospermus]